MPAVYRTADPIDNLLVRVTLARRSGPGGGESSSALVDLTSPSSSSAPAGPSAALALVSTPAAPARKPSGAVAWGSPGSSDDGSERAVELAWQQKVFGPRCVMCSRVCVRSVVPPPPHISPPHLPSSSLRSELLLYAQAAADRRAGKSPSHCLSSYGVDLTVPVVAESVAEMDRRLAAGEDLFASAAPLMLYTHTDREGFVSPGEAGRSGVDMRLPAALSAAAVVAGAAGPTATAAASRLATGALAGISQSTLVTTLTAAAAQAGHRGSHLAGAGGLPGALPAPGAAAAGGAAAPQVPAPADAASSAASSPATPPAGRSAPSSSASERDAVPPSSLTSAVLDPLADPHGVGAHAFKEHPYTTMHIMAAVGVDVQALRAGNLATPMTIVCLAVIRAYKSSSLVEMRPGFAEPVPYERPALVALSRTLSGEPPASGAAAAAILIAADTKLGVGRYGGTLRLRALPTEGRGGAAALDATGGAGLSETMRRSTADLGRTLSAAPPGGAAERPGSIVAYALETHRCVGKGDAEGP